MLCRCRSDNRASRGSSRNVHLSRVSDSVSTNVALPHANFLVFLVFISFHVCSANVAQRLRARAGLLESKREPDDNDEVCSHPANETPRSAPSLHAMQISLTPAMNQTQCFSSQHFSKAIIHKGHAKGNARTGNKHPRRSHTRREKKARLT